MGAIGGQEYQAPGRCRGGFSSKSHAKVDSFGLPLGFMLTDGQKHEIKMAKDLLSNDTCEYLLADRAYDSNEFRDVLKSRGVEAVIPSKKIEFSLLSMMPIFTKKEIMSSGFYSHIEKSFSS